MKPNSWIRMVGPVTILTASWLGQGHAAGQQVSVSMQTMHTATRQVTSQTTQSGDVNNLFKMTQAVVNQTLTSVGIQRSSLPPETQQALNTPPTQNLGALVAFSVGLDNLDRGDFRAARVAFNMAAKQDPGFELATRTLNRTPFSAMSVNDLRQQSQTLSTNAATQMITNTFHPIAATPASTAPPVAGRGADNLERLVSQTSREVSRTAEQLGRLENNLRTNPGQAQQLLRNAVANNVDPALALETVLVNTSNPSRQEVAGLLQVAAQSGITTGDLNRVTQEVQNISSNCR